MRFDRLSALMHRFVLRVTPVATEDANFLILAGERSTTARKLMLSANHVLDLSAADHGKVEFSAWMDWGGNNNPLMAALPPVIELTTGDDEDLESLIRLLLGEYTKQRCGFTSVLDRLGEVLIVRLLRKAIEMGSAQPGLLGGLSDPRISRSIIAMHEAPNRPWKNEDLADSAGLSKSRYLELFKSAVGMTPATYLRKWRLALARQDIERGERIGKVAWRYCYGSSEAFGRAYRREFQESPTGRR